MWLCWNWGMLMPDHIYDLLCDWIWYICHYNTICYNIAGCSLATHWRSPAQGMWPVPLILISSCCCMSQELYFFLCFQFSSVAQSCLTLCDPMTRSTPGLPVHHHLPEFTQTHIHRVGDAIQPSHPLSSPSPPALNPSQHQSRTWLKWLSTHARKQQKW